MGPTRDQEPQMSQLLCLASAPPTEPEVLDRAVRTLQGRPAPLAPLTDVEQKALEAIYLGYRDMMLRVATRFAIADAEDVVQEVALRLPALLPQYQHGGLGGWLRRIVVTTALMRLRREGRRASLDELTEDAEPLPDVVAERVDLTRRALAVLPRPQREVVVLRFFLDYSHEEIARALGITATASEIRLCRALKVLRARFAGPMPSGERSSRRRAS